MTEDRAEKRRRVLRVLADRGGDALVLTSPTSCSWYLEGARSQVALLGPAVLAVEVRQDRDIVHVPQNEFARLRDEELPADVDVQVGGWADWLPSRAEGVIFEEEIESELRAARSPLLPGDIDRYRSLSRDVARVMTDVLLASLPADSELDLAAELASAVTRIGAEPVVVLVAGEGRLHHRHPLPTDAVLGERTMAVIGARRHGLITNLTRWVRSRPQSVQERATELAVLQVESTFLKASTNGSLLSEAFATGVAAYERAGFASDEWQNHHQGGVAGYAGRDPRGMFDVHDVIQYPTAFAWNPSVPAGKVEDTILLTDVGPEVLTVDERWPTLLVDGIARPTEMVR